MSRIKLKEQMVYFVKNIRKNNLPKQSTQRPKTTSRPRYFASRGYKQLPQPSSNTINSITINHQQSPLSTLQLNNNIYIRFNRSPSRKKAHTFLQTCLLQKHKQNKIKRITHSGKIKLDQQNNMQQFVDGLIDSNYFFQKLERTMIQSLVLIGSNKIYEKGTKMQIPRKNIGFILYGRAKLYDKSKDYQYFVQRGDTIGQHQLFGIQRNININMKLRILEDTAILWVLISNYNVLRQQTVKQGFRHDFNKIQTQLRLSFIKKKINKE